MKIECVLITGEKTVCTASECEKNSLRDYVYHFANGSILLKTCPICGRIYITKHQLNAYSDEFFVAEDLNLKQSAADKSSFVDLIHPADTGSISAYVYYNHLEQPECCPASDCHHNGFLRQQVLLKNKRRKMIPVTMLRCEKCGTYICAYSRYSRNTDVIRCINPEDLSSFKKRKERVKEDRKERRRLKKEALKPKPLSDDEKAEILWKARARFVEEQEKLNKAAAEIYAEKKETEDRQKEEENRKKDEQYLATKEAFYRRQRERELLEIRMKEELMEKNRKEIRKAAEQERMKKRAENLKKMMSAAASVRNEHVEGRITAKDFMIRCSVFHCMNKEHSLKNIVAVVGLIDRDGDYTEATVSAGYCEQCNIYYMMESSYMSLRRQGKICCRVFDEKRLSNPGISGGFNMSDTSVLMDYGYSVSYQKNIPVAQRQSILAMLIDNGIISKTGIISYLDFFITHHGSNAGMEIAVSKWEEDRAFVQAYKTGQYKKIIVNSLRRR